VSNVSRVWECIGLKADAIIETLFMQSCAFAFVAICAVGLTPMNKAVLQ